MYPCVVTCCYSSADIGAVVEVRDNQKLFYLYKICCTEQEDEHVERIGEMINAHKILIGKPEGNRTWKIYQ
jgi:hypothetical protein